MDVSKSSLDICIDESKPVKKYSNDVRGQKELIDELNSLNDCHVVMEATGGYEQKVFESLCEAGIKSSIVNPRCVRYFAKSRNILAKTDGIDTRVIKKFGEINSPRVTSQVSKNEQILKGLCRRREQLIELIKREKQNLELAEGYPEEDIKKSLESLKNRLKKIEEEVEETINCVEKIAEKSELLKSFKGVGDVAALVLICDLPELGKLTPKEISALVGLAPFNRDSGNLNGKRIIYGGRSRARCSLYMCALSAKRHNPQIKKMYDRLIANGKTKKTALIACAHKIIVVLNAMLRTQTQWDPEHLVKTTGYATIL